MPVNSLLGTQHQCFLLQKRDLSVALEQELSMLKVSQVLCFRQELSLLPHSSSYDHTQWKNMMIYQLKYAPIQLWTFYLTVHTSNFLESPAQVTRNILEMLLMSQMRKPSLYPIIQLHYLRYGGANSNSSRKYSIYEIIKSPSFEESCSNSLDVSIVILIVKDLERTRIFQHLDSPSIFTYHIPFLGS